MTIILMDKTYNGESLGQDVEEDVRWTCFEDPTVEIPLDDNEFQLGTFRVVITWEPESESH